MLMNDTRERALDVRRKVLGDEYVEQSVDRATEFTLPLQEFVTDHCWGSVWLRPGLDHRTRSLLNVAMLAVMGKEKELRLHVAGALRNGCTEVEVQEVLLQVGVYAGVPAAVSAFGVARDAIADYRGEEEAPTATG